MSNWKQKYTELDAVIREKRPMIHHITNYVVMNVTANVTLAMGASPVMAHANEEVEEMVAFASAHVLNPVHSLHFNSKVFRTFVTCQYLNFHLVHGYSDVFGII